MIDTAKIYFKTRIFPLWVFAVAAAFILLPFIKSYFPSLTEVCVGLAAVYFTGFFTLRQLVFKDDVIEIRNVFFPFNNTVVKSISYSSVFAVEIRNIKAPYQQPYVILHYNEKSLNSKWFILRSGIYNDSDDLSELIAVLNRKNGLMIENY
ncbi:MAG: hypothetical protein RL204_360 [Bacteroidota bacterium]|jgi:hypothetical protein